MLVQGVTAKVANHHCLEVTSPINQPLFVDPGLTLFIGDHSVLKAQKEWVVQGISCRNTSGAWL
jgi:hypothetical protein